MSCTDFNRLSLKDQRALLVQVFQRRVEHARNLLYEVDLSLHIFENRDGHPGNMKVEAPFRRCRAWRLGGSYRMDSDMFIVGEHTKVYLWGSTGFDAKEGTVRSTVRNNGDNKAFGRIDTVHDPVTRDNTYRLWLDGQNPDREAYLFPYLLSHQRDFHIEVIADQERVQLTVGFRPWWTEKGGGKRVLLLDPQKGFLPVRAESRWDWNWVEAGKKMWRLERFIVEQSRLVGDVWMPIKLREESAASSAPETIAVQEITVRRIEHGTVKPADLNVPFTKGMEVVDAIKGITYHTDAQGNPVGPIEPVMGASPAATAGGGFVTWRRYVAAVASIVMIVSLLVILYLRRQTEHSANVT